MDDKQLEELLKLISLGQAAFARALEIINNHKAQSGKTTDEILTEAKEKTEQALEVINNL